MGTLNFGGTGSRWKEWGSRHPISDDWMLSGSHRSTLFTRDEVVEFANKVTAHDIQQILYTGTPEDVATRAAPWFKAAGATEIPMVFHGNASTHALPELNELADDGLPRWHHLNVRYYKKLNELLAPG
jgi:alkanesulfonate monooxygenase SsuD/methylene tetrahydromethanopterin reductase-like flavin-dependent oxidoreductase (luciferase family)